MPRFVTRVLDPYSVTTNSMKGIVLGHIRHGTLRRVTLSGKTSDIFGHTISQNTSDNLCLFTLAVGRNRPAHPDFNRMTGLYFTIGFCSQYYDLKNKKWTIQGPSEISIDLGLDAAKKRVSIQLLRNPTIQTNTTSYRRGE